MEEALIPQAAGAITAGAVGATTSFSRCCTARSARTGRCRARWSWRASRTSAPASSARRSAWTRTSPSACCATPGSRSSTSRVVTAGAFRRDPAAALRIAAAISVIPLFVKPANAGSSVGVRTRRAVPPSSDAAVRDALAFDTQGAGRARRRRARDRVRGARATTIRRPRSPARSSSTTRTASIRTTRSTSIAEGASWKIPAESAA